MGEAAEAPDMVEATEVGEEASEAVGVDSEASEAGAQGVVERAAVGRNGENDGSGKANQ